jgi:nitroreductase
MSDKFEIILENILSRKSVRHFLSRPVSKDQLEILMKTGMAAPTANNRQPWAFAAITERETLDFLARSLPYARMLAQAGAAIVVCGDMDRASANSKKELWIQDCSAATENILLAAEGMGLGAVWTALYPYEERYSLVQKTLAIPDHILPLCIIPVGYPEGTDKPKDKFSPGNIHWERW